MYIRLTVRKLSKITFLNINQNIFKNHTQTIPYLKKLNIFTNDFHSYHEGRKAHLRILVNLERNLRREKYKKERQERGNSCCLIKAKY